MQKIFFVSGSGEKFEEMKVIFDLEELEIVWYQKSINELQTDDAEQLIKKKALEAFKEIRRPVLVEHTALSIEAFNKLPGLQTDYFYSCLGCKKIVDFCKTEEDFVASVKSIFCFCDGKNFYIAEDEECGRITNELDEEEAFAWDKIFIPEENNEDQLTYSKLKTLKNEVSMRKKAWVKLKNKYKNQILTLNRNIDDTEDIKRLAKLIKDGKVLLFLGAGISASLKFGSWSDLIGDLGRKIGYDPELFQIYGDYMMLAEYAELQLKSSLYQYIKEKFSITNRLDIQEKLKNSKIYRNIMKLNFPLIYTTNYDHLIEEYLDFGKHKYNKVTNIEDIKEADPRELRIVKFHGDIEDEKMIVLSESQYFKRMDFQSFLDVMLQADMLQYHVLFLGYSMSDINIKLLLYLARKRWENRERPMQAYIFTATPNEIQKEVFKKNNIISFSGEQTDKEKST